MERYYFCSGRRSTLSNFYKCRVKIWNLSFSSSEQAYQYFKALFHDKPRLISRILATDNPHRIYRYGHSIPTCEMWKSERVEVMLHILRHKLYQCPEFRSELLSTGDLVLTEQTSDSFWAIGNGFGWNTLGVLLHCVKLEYELEMLSD